MAAGTRIEVMEMAVFNPDKGGGYEWGKGLATTQTDLVNPQMNCKGKATEFKRVITESLRSPYGQNLSNSNGV